MKLAFRLLAVALAAVFLLFVFSSFGPWTLDILITEAEDIADYRDQVKRSWLALMILFFVLIALLTHAYLVGKIGFARFLIFYALAFCVYLYGGIFPIRYGNFCMEVEVSTSCKSSSFP